MNDLYRVDGVNVSEGDNFSKFAKTICTRSYGNSPFVEVTDLAPNSFRGPRMFRLKEDLPKKIGFDAAPDGIGTKVILIDAASMHGQAASNLIAMTNGDITRWGGKGIVFFNVLDVETLGENGDEVNVNYRRMMGGLGEIARREGFVCFRGETAELSVCIGSENPVAGNKFNWSGVMLGMYLPDRAITGDTLAPGQAVIALCERGFRSNGISSARAALRIRFGDEWYKNPEAASPIRDIASPATLYDCFLTEMNGWRYPLSKPLVQIHAIAHISGGGIVDKFWKDLLVPKGLSAELSNLYEMPSTMQDVVAWRGMAEKEAYKTFCCGSGALVVIDRQQGSSFVRKAEEYGLEAQACGTITQEQTPTLAICSPQTGDLLEYTQ